jgi:hypothetical protein
MSPLLSDLARKGDYAMEAPKTSTEALECWRDAYKYIGDGDSGVTPAQVYAAANSFIHLVEVEGKTLEDVVPDDSERREIEEHIGQYQASLMEC